MTRKMELLELEAEEPEMLYAILCKLPKPLDIEDLITRTCRLFEAHPPEALPWSAWRHVSTYSVLKTTRDETTLSAQTLREGEALLKKHSDQIERKEARKRMLLNVRSLAHQYRRPASAVSFAVVVGLVSLWLGRNGQSAALQSMSATARHKGVEFLSYILALVRG